MDYTDKFVMLTVKNQINQTTTVGQAEISTPLHSRNKRNSVLNRDPLRNAAEVNEFHSMFSIRAQQHPDKKAVVCGTKSISYQELDERATLLCNYLMQRGIRRGRRIGVLLGRSFDSFPPTTNTLGI